MSLHMFGREDAEASGYIAQWLERLTADQQVPGSNKGPETAMSSI